MSTWLSLLKKEFCLTKSFILGGIFFLCVMGFIEVYLTYRYKNPGIISFSLLLIIPHLLYMVLYLLRSLSKEWNHTAQLWLHLPQSGPTLLSAKLACGFIAMTVSLGITLAFTVWSAIVALQDSDILQRLPFDWNIIWQYGLYLTVGLIFLSLYLGLWAMLISVIVASAKRFIKRGSWLVGIAVFLFSMKILDLWQSTIVYDKLTNWGLIDFHLKNTTINDFNIHADLSNVHPLYTGDILYFVLFMVALFFLSAWILDNKVEV